MTDKILIRLRNKTHTEIITDSIQIDKSMGSIHLQEILEATHDIKTRCLFFIGTQIVSDSLAKLTELIKIDLEEIIVIDYIDPSEIIEDSKFVLDEHIQQILTFQNEIYVLLYNGDLVKLIYDDKKMIKLISGISIIGAGEQLLGIKNNCVINIKTGEELRDLIRKELVILQLSVSNYGYSVAYSDNTIVIYDFNGIIIDSVQCSNSCSKIKLGEISYEHDKRDDKFRKKLWWIDKLDLLMEYDITKNKIKQTFTNTVLVNFCVVNNVIYACTSENRLLEILPNKLIAHDICVRLVDSLEFQKDTLLMFTQFEVLSYDVGKYMEINCLRVKEQITSHIIFGDKLLISAENIIYCFNISSLLN